MRIDPLRLMRLGELIRQGTFKRAAERLHITQPALSQSIAQMEGEVGLKLIKRTPYGVVPTVYGQALVEHAKAVEWQLGEAAKKIVELTSGRAGGLSIGGTSGGAITILSRAVLELGRTHPGAETRLFEETWNLALLDQVDDRSLDAAICHLPKDEELEGKVAVPLFRAERFLCVRTGHPMQDHLTPETLVGYPIACPTGEIEARLGIQRVFEQLHMDFPPLLTMISNSLSAAKEAVLSSDAFAIFSDLSVLHEREQGMLKLAPIEGVSTSYWYYLIARRDYVINDLMLDCLAAIGRTCASIGVELHPKTAQLRLGQPLRR